ncbi:uncharacterized protein LOC143276848 [Babylonia areolata]|uniref:uncharacterized protein LOC143276848 n=1 Tax=Babylonia areolata TaxID=304850 RepID=UPI003FD3D7DA
MNTSPLTLNTSDDTITEKVFSSSDFQTALTIKNNSLSHGCTEVFFDEMEYIPWDNPQNLISAETEFMVHRIQDNTLAVLFVIGAPANIINMLVFYKQGLKDRVNLCLFALSFSDLMFLITFMFMYGDQLHLQFTTQEKYGPLTKDVFNHNFVGFAAFGYVSNVLSTIIATERCLCVFNPLKFQQLIRTRTMAVIIFFIYIVVLGLFFIVVFRYRIGCLYDPPSGVVVTTFVKGEFYLANKKVIDFIDSVTFGAGLPGTVLIVTITTTLLTIIKLRQVVSWRSDQSSSISPREVALTKMLVANSILFIICFSPDAINHLSRLFLKGMNSGGIYHNFYLTALWIGDIFTFFNATLNIFVYYTMGSRYREVFWTLFGRKIKTEKQGACGAMDNASDYGSEDSRCRKRTSTKKTPNCTGVKTQPCFTPHFGGVRFVPILVLSHFGGVHMAPIVVFMWYPYWF